MSSHVDDARTVVIVADDLTGALDAGLQFAARGLETQVSLHLSATSLASVVVLNADSRGTDRQAAVTRMLEAAQVCRGHLVYKKVDSTLRGHVGPEAIALRDALGLSCAVIAPAFIQTGRTVRGGQLLVGGVPVEQTALAHDPVWPAQSADVRKLVGRGVAEPVSLIELGVVHQGPGAVVSRVKALSLCVAEAETLDDLGVLGEALASLQGYVLPCGSAGLAAAWADAQGLHGDCTPTWRGVDGPVLIVSGSRNAATLAQLQALYDADSRLAWCELDVQAAERAVDQAGRQAAEALRDGRNTVLSASRGPLVPGAAARTAGALGQAALGATTSGASARAAGRSLAGLVLTGGDTAMQVCQALGIAAFSVVTAIEPGIPGSLAISGPLAGLPIVTKAGGFGSLQALRRAVEWIHTGQEPFGGDDAA